MSRHALSVHYVDVLAMLGLALVFLWLRLIGVSVRGLCAHAVLTVTGYLRPRPDPAVESALRAAFADSDRDLAGILGDRMPTQRPAPDRWPSSEADTAGCRALTPAMSDRAAARRDRPSGALSSPERSIGAATGMGGGLRAALAPPRFLGSVSRRSASAGHICTAWFASFSSQGGTGIGKMTGKPVLSRWISSGTRWRRTVPLHRTQSTTSCWRRLAPAPPAAAACRGPACRRWSGRRARRDPR